MKLITTKEAAEKLGVNVQRVRQLIKAGRLPAQKVGRDWVIRPRDLEKVAHRKPGRPRKADTAKSGKKRGSQMAVQRRSQNSKGKGSTKNQ